MLTPAHTLAMALDPCLILKAQAMQPDPWQRELLLSTDRQTLLMCSRGAGKSRTTSALALHTALFTPKAKVLLVSRAQRQSMELFRYVKEGFRAIGSPIPLIKETETQCEFQNESRIIALPGKEETIRSLQGVTLLILDEAARIPDDLYRSVRPMLVVSQGRLVALTTPFGQRGWFFNEWERDNTFCKVKIPWNQCPRISPAFIAEEKASMGEQWVNQEYECLFTAS